MTGPQKNKIINSKQVARYQLQSSVIPNVNTKLGIFCGKADHENILQKNITLVSSSKY